MKHLLKDTKFSSGHVEFTAPETPHQNGVVERAFSYLYDRVRAMLNGAGLKLALREKMWTECARTATQLEKVTVKVNQDLSPKCFLTTHVSL